LNVDESLSVTVLSSATGGRGGAYSYQLLGGSGSATIDAVSGYLTAISAGTVTVGVSSSGDGDYYSASTSQEVSIGKTTPSLSIISDNTMSVNSSLTVTIVSSATGGRGGAYSYQVLGGSGSATIDESTGYLTSLSSGTVTVVATSAGDGDYYSATASQLITIGRSTPTLTITSSNSLNVDGSLSVTVVTTAIPGREGVLSYSIVPGSGSATIDAVSGYLTAISAGTVTLQVSSAENSYYYSVGIAQEITIGKTTPSLSITSANALNVDDVLVADAFSSATFNRGGSISFMVFAGSGSATINPDTSELTAISAGTVTLVASSAGDGDYYPSSVSQLVTISPTTPTLSITSDNHVGVDGTLTVTITTSATLGRGGNMTYSIIGGSGSATVDSFSGLVTGIGAGTVTLTVSSSGDTDYYSAGVTQEFTIDMVTPTLSITSSDVLNVDESLTVTVVSTSTGGRGGAIAYAVIAGSGSATVDGISGYLTAISAGTATLVATSAGDTDYNGASVTQEISIGKTTPSLSISSANALNVDESLSVTVLSSATGGRGGAYSYSLIGGSGSATIDAVSGYLTAINAGTVTVGVSSSGDGDYYAASTTQEISIGKATPSLSITSASALTVDGSLSVTVLSSATGGRGGAYSYQVLGGSGSATIDSVSGYLTAISAGTVTVGVSSSGDGDYYSASTSQEISIGKATPSLSITSASASSVDGSLTVTVVSSATGGRGGSYSYQVLGGSGSATIDTVSGYLMAINAGTVTIGVSSSGDGDYYGGNTTQEITIGKNTPTLSITSSDTMYVDGTLTATVTTTATGGRGGVITFSVRAGSGSATVDVNTGYVRAVGAGTVILTALSAGDSDYIANTQDQQITIGKTTPSLSITSGNSVGVDGTLTVTTTTSATLGRGGNMTYSIIGGSGSATVDGSTGLIQGISVGSVTLIATSAGDADYYSSNTSQLITINKVTPTLIITSVSNTIVDADLTATVVTTATGERGGNMTYSIIAGSGSATVNATTGLIHAVNAGTITLMVTSAGDTDYYSASTSQLINIGKATPTLVITSANSMIVDGVLTATISSSVASPGTITYSVTNGTGIIVVVSNTGKVTAIQAGGSTLKATSAGTSNYYPVTVSHVMTINKATPTLTITSPTGSTMIVNRSLTVTFTTSATLNRGGAKSYAITAGSGSATINPTTGFMTAVSVGTVTLTVSTAGDASYYLASASKLITITASMLAVDPVVTNPVLPKEKPAPISTLGQEEHNDSEDQTVGVSMVISPNGDGLNDVLVINRIEDHPDNEVVIANRSGEMVFKTHGYNNGTVVFAGASNTGAPLANGVYYYTLLFYDQGKLNRRVGYFELRR
jgi:hypothetical protein